MRGAGPGSWLGPSTEPVDGTDPYHGPIGGETVRPGGSSRAVKIAIRRRFVSARVASGLTVEQAEAISDQAARLAAAVAAGKMSLAEAVLIARGIDAQAVRR